MQIPLAMVQNSIAASKANFVVITLELNQFVPYTGHTTGLSQVNFLYEILSCHDL